MALEVERHNEARSPSPTGSTVPLPVARIGPSMPRKPKLRGGSSSVKRRQRHLRGFAATRRVSASPDARRRQADDHSSMAWSREKRDAARQAKLEDIREQVASGTLLIREMTEVERVHWAARDAKWTPEERERRDAALRNRRRREKFDAE